MRTIRDPPQRQTIDWQQLLVDAVTKPGLISSAYTAFWNYSLGNMIWAHLQCLARGIEVGPIHTFRGWLKLGRHVRRGEKALTLVMPVTVKRKRHEPVPADALPDTADDPQTSSATYTRFVERPFWFTLSQTDGEPYTPLSVPVWDEALALYTLGITREPYRHGDGNCQGYAHDRSVAVSPLTYLPHRTLFHEIAHVLLGHTAEVMGLSDTDAPTPRDLREVEAECVAMLCGCSLGLPGEDYSRGYVQHWFKSDVIPERSVQRIFKAADTLLKAGSPPATPAEADAPAV
jgi:antirestriction protein ArdC